MLAASLRAARKVVEQSIEKAVLSPACDQQVRPGDRLLDGRVGVCLEDTQLDRCRTQRPEVLEIVVGRVSSTLRRVLSDREVEPDGRVGLCRDRTSDRDLLGIVGTDSNDLNRIGEELDELGLEVNDEDLIRAEYTTPYSGFDVAPEEE